MVKSPCPFYCLRSLCRLPGGESLVFNRLDSVGRSPGETNPDQGVRDLRSPRFRGGYGAEVGVPLRVHQCNHSLRPAVSGCLDGRPDWLGPTTSLDSLILLPFNIFIHTDILATLVGKLVPQAYCWKTACWGRSGFSEQKPNAFEPNLEMQSTGPQPHARSTLCSL